MLDRHFAPLTVSRAYANAAVGFEGDDFINLVVGFRTGLTVHHVIERLHEAEAACGRERLAPKWAPRSMDLDILLFGDTVRGAKCRSSTSSARRRFSIGATLLPAAT